MYNRNIERKNMTTEEKKEYNRQWRKANKEKVRESARRYREKNREKMRARWNQYHKDNPKKHRANQRSYIRKNPIRAKFINTRSQIRRRLEKYNIEDKNIFTLEEGLALYEAQMKRCAYCGKPLSTSFSVDHIVPVSRGGASTIDNIALACRKCNSTKGQFTPQEYIDWLKYEKGSNVYIVVETLVLNGITAKTLALIPHKKEDYSLREVKAELTNIGIEYIT